PAQRRGGQIAGALARARPRPPLSARQPGNRLRRRFRASAGALPQIRLPRWRSLRQLHAKPLQPISASGFLRRREDAMATRYEDYANKYKFVKFERRDGIVQITLHKDGGPAVWDASIGGIHDELGDAFYQAGRDLEANVIILTGAGDTFLTQQGVSGARED